MIHAAYASQGHRYQYGTLEVLAMQSGHVVIVRPINAAMAKFVTEQRDMFNHDEEAIACFCGD